MRPCLEILRVCWPLAIGMVNNALMQFADRAFLAHESMASLEAVLPASTLAFVALGFFQAIVAYSGTFVAQYHGARNPEGCRLSYRIGQVLALAAGVLVLPVIPLGSWILSVLSLDAAIAARADVYFTLTIAGGVCLFGQMAAQAYFTGLGRTRLVLFVNMLGNALNVALDPFLIFGWCGLPRLGIAGAALATVFALGVQWALLAVFAQRESRRAAVPREGSVPCPDWKTLGGRILRYGLPSGAYAVASFVTFTSFVFLTGRIGHVEAAVSNAVLCICYLLYAPMEGFSLGAAALVGQARGRRDEAEAMRIGWRTIFVGCSVAAVLAALALVFQRPLLALFAPGDAAMAERFYELGRPLVWLMASWLVFDVADTIFAGSLRGAGDTHFVMWWVLVASLLVWLPLLLLARAYCNTTAALWATTVLYVVVLFVGSCVRWGRGRWKLRRIV